MTWAARIPTLGGSRYPLASFVLDFVNNYYRGSGALGSSPSVLPGYTFTRATPSTAYAEDTNGNLIPFAANTPRITNKGVLIEEARTNLALQSQTFSSWYGEASGVTTNAIVAPDGTLTGAKLRSANSSVYQSLFYQPTFAAGGATITRSIYAKAGEYSWAYLQQYDETTNRGAYFNLATGQVGNVETGVTASITPASGGWYRLSVTFSAAPGATYERVQISLAQSNGGSPVFTGDGASGFYIWGGQLEAGSFPTSYIPTTSSTVTRAADVFSYAGVGVPTLNTIAVSSVVAGYPGDPVCIASVSDGTSNNRNQIRINTGNANIRIVAGGVSQTDDSSGPVISYNTLFTSAQVVNSTYAARYQNGAQSPAGNILITPPTSTTTVDVGSGPGSSTITAYIQRLAIYPFAASDAQLQSISSGNF